MNLKLVKLTPQYKRQLTDMMSEWLGIEADFSPRVIRKNDYRDFDYYLDNLETKHYDGYLVPDSTFFCLDTDRDIFVGAVNIRHYLNRNLYPFGGHIGDGVRPSERRKGIATKMISLALEKCREFGIYRVLMTCDEDNIGSAKSIRNNGGVLFDTLVNEEGVPEQCYWIDLTPENTGLKRGTVKLSEHDPSWEASAACFIGHLTEILGNTCIEARHVGSTAVSAIPAKPIIDIALGVRSMEELEKANEILTLNGIYYRGEDHPGQRLYVCGDIEKDFITHHIHAVPYGSEPWNNYVKLNDYLNKNPGQAQAYADLKKNLAETYASDRKAYTAGKAAFIGELIKKA